MKQKQCRSQLLLLEDIVNLGRKGDLVFPKRGFARNYLLPQKKGVIVDKRTLRLQTRLKEERAKQAVIDRKDAEAFAAHLKGRVFTLQVKADTQGHLYGSVSALDIAQLIEEQEGIKLEKRQIVLPKPIKQSGVYTISLRLKENVPATFDLKVCSESAKLETYVEVVEEKPIPSKEEEVLDDKEEGQESK